MLWIDAGGKRALKRQCARPDGFGRRMRTTPGWMLLAIAAPLGAATDDLSNERPPMTRVQLERHWGVDCARLRGELLVWSREPVVPTPQWSQALGLCAAVHNPPGTTPPGACPDFASVARLLAEDPRAAMADTRTRTRSALECP
jgi:hypothetical protein